PAPGRQLEPPVGPSSASRRRRAHAGSRSAQPHAPLRRTTGALSEGCGEVNPTQPQPGGWMRRTRQVRGLRWLVAAAVFGSVFMNTPLPAQEWPATPPSEPPADWGPVSIDLAEIEYPYPVSFLELNRFGPDMRMAYMDVPPAGTPNGQTVVLFHGMNFYGEAYTPTINALREAGFRVVALDQIGFGKS